MANLAKTIVLTPIGAKKETPLDKDHAHHEENSRRRGGNTRRQDNAPSQCPSGERGGYAC